ncbi:MAG: type 4a pilus biogenesis protein PilO [Firmicutes bacterium]|nr:type 4a pilus biogenesis protein PilO [Bacillota bacterium]MDH7495058.1 type 4a pilus biogenesis protein PilO [Bacillota bacterium]
MSRAASTRSRAWMRLAALAAGFLIAGYLVNEWILSPMSGRAAELARRLDIVTSKIGSVAEKGETLASLRREYERAREALQDVDSTITRETGLPYFVRDLERAASASGAALQDLSIGTLTASSPYSEIPVTVKVRGTYRQVQAFLDRTLSVGRTVSVKGIHLLSTGGAGDMGSTQAIDATFSMVLYVVPKGGGDG